jgi:Ca2+-binding EF-hand superfamily protein
VQELVSGFIALGLEERSKDIVTLVKAYEQKKGYSELGFSEFLDIFSSSDAGFEDSLREVFAAYDKDGKGFI